MDNSRWITKLKQIVSGAFPTSLSVLHRINVIFVSYRILYTFAIICNAPFSQEEKRILRKYLDEQIKRAGSDKALADRWDLELGELGTLKTKLTAD